MNESSSSASSADNAVNHSVKRAILSLYPNAKTTKGIFLRTKKREKKRRQKLTNSSIKNSFNSTIVNHYNRSSFIKLDNFSSSLSSYITPQSSINLPDNNESLFSEKDPVPHPLEKYSSSNFCNSIDAIFDPLFDFDDVSQLSIPFNNSVTVPDISLRINPNAQGIASITTCVPTRLPSPRIKINLKLLRRKSLCNNTLIIDQTYSNNKEYIYMLQSMNSSHITTDELTSISLFIEVKSCPSSKQTIPMFNNPNYQHTISSIISIQRSPVQVYCVRNLHLNYHWTLGIDGVSMFEKDTKCGEKIAHFGNKVDTFLTNDDNDYPIIINTRDPKLDSLSYLKSVNKHWEQFLSTNLFTEYMSLASYNKDHGVISLHVGYTGLEAGVWERSTKKITPRVTSCITKMSVDLRRWIGYIMILLSHDMECINNKYGNEQKLFSTCNNTRIGMRIKLAKTLHVETKDLHKLKVEGCSINISHHVRYHCDRSNDDREQYLFTSVSSKIFPIDILLDEYRRKINFVDGNGNLLFITCVVYTRKVVGQYCERIEAGLKDSNIYYRVLMENLQCTEKHYDYYSFVTNIVNVDNYIQNKSN